MSAITIIEFLAVAIGAFMIGSIPCGVILGKVWFHGDPRLGGSGSIGATNMNRMFGFKAFAVTFVLDAAKGAIAVIFARLVGGFILFDAAWQFDLFIVFAIMFSILGHVFCPWLGFKGGKGISTGFGSVLAGYPFVALCLLITFLLFALISKRISVGSIAAAISFPIYSYIFNAQNIPLICVSIAVAIAVVFAHRSNIIRICKGTEPKFSFNRDKSSDQIKSDEDDA